MENILATDSATNKKRVLVIRNAFVYDFGGAEKLAVNLAHELDLNSMDSVIVSRQPRLIDYAKSQNVKTIRGWWWSKQNWSGKSALLFPAYIVWQIILSAWYLQLFLRLNPDAIHVLSKELRRSNYYWTFAWKASRMDRPGRSQTRF